jgi:hypothetical protein
MKIIFEFSLVKNETLILEKKSLILLLTTNCFILIAMTGNENSAINIFLNVKFAPFYCTRLNHDKLLKR